MRFYKEFILTSLCIGLMVLSGCTGGDDNPTAPTTGGNPAPAGETPEFTLCVSEYPSWSAFIVADLEKVGIVQKVAAKHGIKINIKEMDYDACITAYGTKTVDAVAITNTDILSPALGRDSVAILPTSTSVGGDACLTVGIEGIDDLEGKTTYGLEKSVSELAFYMILKKNGKDPAKYPFKNMDPQAAATAMQTEQEGIVSIMVWNPFVMSTLENREGSKNLFDSSQIPEVIIDQIVIGKDVLAKPGGEKFATAICEIYYELNKQLNDSATGEQTLIAIGAKFSNLDFEAMQKVVAKDASDTGATRFYGTADTGVALYEGEQFQKTTMPEVVAFLVDRGWIDAEPTVGFEQDDAQLNFTTKYMKAASE
ncbi:MAG: hypothetical protein COA78_30560 [Blastopirellula sp.]|nr:MAG: hypothetical protein COA78_30560 [Blastopirellula sp.]